MGFVLSTSRVIVRTKEWRGFYKDYGLKLGGIAWFVNT
jgi:hypothetical protein